MISISPYFSVLLLASALLVSACGGSKSVTAPDIQPLPAPIRVNAGANTSIDENLSLSLLGGSSGGQGAPTYKWQTDAAAQISHDDTSITNATFTAPSVTKATVFLVTLTATDTAGAKQSDSISITVNPVNIKPIALVTANQIQGYASNEFPVTSTIILDGSASTDADPQTNEAQITAYNWQQIAGPNLLAGIDSSLASITMLTPVINETQQATFRLTVSDQEQATSSVDFSITMLGQNRTAVTLDAKSVKSVFSGEILMLSASANSTAPDAPPFSALWIQEPLSAESAESSSNAHLQDPTAFSTAAIAPFVDTDITLRYQITATDSFRNTATAFAEGLVLAPSTRTINDTGVLLFANASQLNELHQNDYPGQDASYGADRQSASGQVLKMGEGDQGFDFTRLSNSGSPIEDTNIAFSCVRDNVTGLVWQVKENQNTSSLNYVEQTFTWYSENDNGNFAGALNTDSTTCNVQSQACNTQAYIAQINTQGLCGSFDWRLPTPNELQSIIHYGKSTPPLLDSMFFPNMGISTEQPLWYWTSQTSADGVGNDIARSAWAFDMNTGSDGFVDKTLSQRVMLLRAGR